MTFTILLGHIHDHMETRLKVHARGVCEAGFHCSMVREQGSLSNSLHLGKRVPFANGVEGAV